MLKSVCRSFCRVFHLPVPGGGGYESGLYSQRAPASMRFPSGISPAAAYVDSFYVLFFHLDNSPFEFAVLCVAPSVRCPAYSPGDSYGPGAYSHRNLCEFVFSFRRRCPPVLGHRWIGPYPGLCVATCSKFFRIISINCFYKNNLFFPATSCYTIYADRNSDAFTRYPRSSVVTPPPRLGRLRTTVAKPRRAWLKLRLFSGWQPFSEHQLR